MPVEFDKINLISATQGREGRGRDPLFPGIETDRALIRCEGNGKLSTDAAKQQNEELFAF